MKTIIDEYFLKSFANDVKVGVSISDNKESYFFAFKDQNGRYSALSKTYSCDIGIAMGNLIGPAEDIANVPTSKEIYSSIENEYFQLKDTIQSSTQSKFELITTVLSACDNFVSYKSGTNDRYTNLLILPLYAEILNGIIKDGVSYDFKKSDKVLKAIRLSQKKLSVFASEVMLYDNSPRPAETLISTDILHRIPSFTYSGITTLVILENGTLKETFISNSFDELISYLVCKYAQNYHFFCCANCRRYFAFSTDSKTKNCSRYIETSNYANDIGKTCHEVGRHRSLSRTLYSDNILKIYQRFYKTAFARKAAGKVSDKNFVDWSILAREQRDKCVKGDITSDQLLEWFEKNNLKE